MKKTELLELIKDIPDEGSVDKVLSNTDFIKNMANNNLTLDNFKSKLKDKDFKSFMDGEKDKHFKKALETWKANNLEKELEPFIKEKYPELNNDPVAKELADLKKQLADEKAANARKDLLNQAIQYANEKKIPSIFVEKFLGDNLDKTKENLDNLLETMNPFIDEKVNERLNTNTFIPGGNGDSSNKGIGEMLAEQFNDEQNPSGLDPWA